MRRLWGSILILIGTTTLAGWWFDVPALRNGMSRGLDLGPAAAMMFFLAGVAVLTQSARVLSRGERMLGQLAAATMVGLATAAAFAPGFPAFERTLIPGHLAPNLAAPRVVLTTGNAILLGLLGVLLSLQSWGGKTWTLFAKTLAGFVAVLAVLAVLAYVAGRAGLDGPGQVPISLSIGVAFLALSLALLSAAAASDELEAIDPSTAALGSRVRFALLVAIAILVTTAGVSLWGVTRSRVAARERAISARWRDQLGGLLSAVQDAETGQRGFLLTGDTVYLSPYHSAVASLPTRLSELKAMADSGADSTGRVDSLRVLVGARMAILDSSVRLGLAGRSGVAVTLVRGGNGAALMRGIRAGVSSLSAEKDSLVAVWDKRLVAHDRLAATSSIVAGLLAVIFLWLAGVAINRDLARAGRAEAAVRGSQQRLSQIIELIPNMVFLKDPEELRFVHFNKAGEALLGIPRSALLGRNDFDFFPEDEAQRFVESDREVLKSREVVDIPEEEIHTARGLRILHTKKVTVRDESGRPLFLLGVSDDITEQKAAERAIHEAKEAAEASNRAKSSFLAKMSHELRTPLNSIIGFSELLEAQTIGTLNPKQRRYVGNVLLSGKSLLSLINDILDLSRVEAGRMFLSPANLDVGVVLEEVRGVVTALAEQKQITLTVAVPEPVPPVWADRGRFVQILFNLVGNAIKFTPNGGRVVLSARHRVEETDRGPTAWVDVMVSDTGIGIAPSDQERIFEEFEQVWPGARGGETGTGLGLPLTRRLVELHGGTITVESVAGGGSTFSCHFPVAHRPEQSGVAPTRGSGSKPPEGRNGTPLVLVVDDEPRARDLLGHYLAESGYRVATVGSDEEAIRAADTLQPDVITLDILMPGRDGVAPLAQLKSSPASAAIPVMVVSVSDQRELGVSLAPEDWLVKPVQRPKLLESLTRILGPKPRGGSHSVLVVDDDAGTREFLEEVLRHQGYSVELAAGGMAGVARTVAVRPDLVLLDLVMPDISGFDVVRTLRADPRTREIPILVLTAKSLTEEESEQLRRSVQGVVPKAGKTDLLLEFDRIWARHGAAGK